MSLRSAIALITLSYVVGLSGQVHASGNGSSGVGNAFVIDGNLTATLPKDSITIDQGEIRDARTKEKLLRITPVTESDMQRYGDKLIRAKLGTVEGLEFVPNINDAKKEHFWVVCQKSGRCVKLTPVSGTNSKVPSVVGALSESEKSP